MDVTNAIGQEANTEFSFKLEPTFIVLIPVIFFAAYLQLAALKVF
ncbi:hypothetical protein SAMN02745866_00815 [Alteromonadaceae bacterium Bs31]|nr:hypothetical protein SAMN02745866_00815 [Alteromonadaceae bacterium Bs31]